MMLNEICQWIATVWTTCEDSNMLRYREVKFTTFCMESDLLSTIACTLSFFYKNMFYENMVAEICAILRVF